MSKNIEYEGQRNMSWSILADGKFHTQVPKETPGAIIREYETSDGKKGVKYEHVASAITGVLTNIVIKATDYGKQLKITLNEGDDAMDIYLSTNSRFGADFMKRLPNIKTEEPIRLFAFAFENDGGKKVRGLNVYQGSDLKKDKVADYYHKKEGDKVESLNGFPEPTEDDKTDWPFFYKKVEKFLIAETEKSSLYNRQADAMSPAFDSETYPKEDINPDDITFD